MNTSRNWAPVFLEIKRCFDFDRIPCVEPWKCGTGGGLRRRGSRADRLALRDGRQRLGLLRHDEAPGLGADGPGQGTGELRLRRCTSRSENGRK